MSANANKSFALGNRSAYRTLQDLFITVIACAVVLNLTACAAPLLALGSGGSAAVSSAASSAASSAGTAAVTVAVANPSTAVSLASTASTGKSPLEHATSAATQKDCNFLNALGPKPICVDVPTPSIKDMSELYLGPADTFSKPSK